ncbi:MAG: hypothetical protein V4819_20240 [Verrucomicrobiota bacterium]
MDGFSIPIGADFSAMQAAVAQICAKFDELGDRITQALNQSAAASANASQQLAQTVATAQALGTAATGAHDALKAMQIVSQTLSRLNLASRFSGWITSMGGIRGALSGIGTRMMALARNRTFQIIAVSAVAAVTAIYTVRTAFRFVAGSVNLLRSTATGAFRAIGNAARSAGAAVSSAFAGIGALTPGGPLIAGLLSVAGVLGVVSKSISKAAEMETLETAFAPLLGGAEAAKERIADLAKFAKDTPFELPEISQASRVLQTLTKGAIATGAGLRLVGDVASGTQQPIEELAVWIGRLYDGLQSGRPVGEAMARLTELGAMSADVRNKIEDLQKSGAKGPAVWNEAAAALGVFSGSMERQSKTWKGKLSNLSDSVGMLMAKFGEPIIDALKPFLDGMISRVESLQGVAIRAGNAIRTALNGAMAAFETGTVIALLGVGLELAFTSAINLLMRGLKDGMTFLSIAVSGIFGSIKESLMKSGIANVFGHLADALGSTISAAIMSSIGKVSGWKGWEVDAGKERFKATESMFHAKEGMKHLDVGGGIQAGIDRLAEALKQTQELSKNGGKPFIDQGPILQELAELGRILQINIDKRQAAAAASTAKMEAAMKRPPGIGSGEASSPMETVSRAVAPAVMSLTRIGGGGFSNTVLNGQLTEAKRQTGFLQKILRTLEQPAKPISARYA